MKILKYAVFLFTLVCLMAVTESHAGITNPTPETILSGPSATFIWSAVAGADSYWLYVGTTAGGKNISTGAVAGTTTALTNLPTNGSKVYVRLWTRIGGAWQTPLDYTYTAADLRAKLTTPTPETTLTGSTVTFSWTTGTGASDYWLDVGIALGKGTIAEGVVTGTSKTVSNLPFNGGKVYVRLWTRIGGAWQTPLDYTYTAADLRAKLTTPAIGTTLSGSTTTFSWTTGTGASDYWLDVGTAVGTNNLSAGVVTATSKTVSNLPVNGSTVFVKLWMRVGGIWQTPVDYTFTSNWRIPGIVTVEGGVEITFTSSVGRFYQLQATDNFADPSLPWTVARERIPGEGSITRINIPVAAGVARRFWRIALLPL